jgi:hypothetical protein
VRRLLSLTLLLSALAGFVAARSDAGILFAKGTGVPPEVQAFAWRVIETRCRGGYDIRERSFWAYDAREVRVDARVVHSIKILSELTWKKTEPTAFIEMTIVDDGGLRLTALTSSFSACLP